LVKEIMENNVCARVVFTGRVQGVFFRMETKRTAEKYLVTGWVRNTADGAVEAVFEGEKEKVSSLLRWFDEQGPTLADIENIKINREEYSGRFSEFKITR
jgi:acylphosphatase